MKNLLFTLVLLFGVHPQKEQRPNIPKATPQNTPQVSILILGNIQDAGAPQIGCTKACCAALFEHPDPTRMVTALGLIDHTYGKKYLFEATPDMTRQVKTLKSAVPKDPYELPDGIFLTHAHMGHYTGLANLGKEAINSKNVPVFAMPKMSSFLQNNGPWSQLVTHKNIQIETIKNEQEITLSAHLKVSPIRVPHRDEFSETVGYKIIGPNKSALFIPDIDKWEKWETSILEVIKEVDYAFIDGTFFSGKELMTRDLSQVPHPFITQSMQKFKGLSATNKAKIVFIHFNHTNPVINPASEASQQVLRNGFKIARYKDTFDL